jgi:hypothetical protein
MVASDVVSARTIECKHSHGTVRGSSSHEMQQIGKWPVLELFQSMLIQVAENGIKSLLMIR